MTLCDVALNAANGIKARVVFSLAASVWKRGTSRRTLDENLWSLPIACRY